MRLFKSLDMELMNQVKAAVSALVLLLVVGTVTYRYLEGWSWVDSFYFSAMTLTTVGYGDLAPSEGFPRIFTAFYALVGVGIALASLAVIGTNYLRRRQEALRARSESAKAE